jgi:DNA-binding protein YbaB
MTKSKPQIKIVNCETGEEIIRDANAQELAQMEIDATNDAATKAETEAKAQAKALAEGKLAALGLTTDDLKALGL